ncbi:MAG: hypothetical protein OHK0056_23450 [Bacteriovoracaceae bacterium]
MAIVLTIKTPDEIWEYELTEDSIILGRADDCNISLNDAGCSSRHCQISKRNKGIWVKDLNSKNGTHINGQKISSQMMMIDDVIQIGGIFISIKQQALSTVEAMALGKGRRKSKQDLTLPVLKPHQQEERSRSFRRHHGAEDKTGVSVVKQVKKLSDYHKKIK